MVLFQLLQIKIGDRQTVSECELDYFVVFLFQQLALTTMTTIVMRMKRKKMMKIAA